MSEPVSEREQELFDLIVQGVMERYGPSFDCSGAVVTRAASVARALSDGMILDVDVGGGGYRPAPDAGDHGGIVRNVTVRDVTGVFFQSVRLYTAGGPYVDEERFVVAGEIPAFNTQPDVLIWGERLFRFACVMDTHLVYVEAFSAALVRTAS